MSGINPYSFLSGWGSASQGSAWPVQQTQIISLPQSLNQLKQTAQIKGEIGIQNADGTTQVKTPQGDITLKLQNALPAGIKIDIQIPSGQSPKEAFIQPRLTAYLNSGQQDIQTRTNPTVDTVTTAPARPTPNQDMKNLQSTAQQANITTAQKGEGAPAAVIKEGQAIRVTPLPAPLQSFPAIARELTAPSMPQANAVLNPALRLPEGSPPQFPPSPFLTPPAKIPLIRQSLLPATMTYHVSGDRTVRQIISGMPPLETDSVFLKLTADNKNLTNATRPLLPFTQPADMRVMKMVEPMHIRPPMTFQSAVAISSITGEQQQAFRSLTLLNSFAGEAIALSTGFVTDDGNPVLEIILPASQAQMVSVNYPARALPAGTQISLSPLSYNIMRQNGPDMPQAAGSPLTDMQETLETLLQSLPSQQMQQILDMIPSATNARQFPAAALLFLAAAKGGDLSAWLGKKPLRTVDGLPATSLKQTVQKGLSDLLTNGTGQKPAPTDPASVQTGDWRGHTLPLLAGIDAQAATLWVRDNMSQSDSQADMTKDKGTRFVVDLNLSRMGPIQFDGLIFPDRKTLDLSFITQRDLAKPMQDSLKTLWYNTLENLGYSGSINFRKL